MLRRKTDPGEPLPSCSGVRVLVVDDEDDYRSYLCTLVRRLGCTVVTADDGADALAKLAASSFDLLLSDLEMPKLNGLALIEHVRAHPTFASIYAVMVTARGDEQSKVAALTRGFDDFLPKSCSELEVASRVGAAGRLLARQRVLDAEVVRWRTLATRDELTNVATRRTFVETASEHLAVETPVAVVMLDLDDFKQVNDTHGHLAGDRILRDVGALLLARTRSDDVVARYGGDEFVFLIPEVTLQEVTAFAERVTADIADLRWRFDEETLRITACAGIAHSELLEQRSVDQLLDVADRDLYGRKWVRKHPPTERPDVYAYPEGAAQIVALPPIITRKTL